METNILKKLIFDIDGTIIKWEEKFNYSMPKALEQINFKYSDELCSKIWKTQFDYENKIGYYDDNTLLNYFNSKLNLKLPIEFIYYYRKNIEECVPEKFDENIIKTLEYLSNKYELVILTNWFANNQIERLRKINILQYFSKIYGGEKYCKPKKEAFTQTFEKLLPTECAMIGDNLEKDIISARNAGIQKLFWINNQNKTYNTDLNDIIVLDNILQLKDLL